MMDALSKEVRSVCVCACAAERSLARHGVRHKVNVYADNGDDVLKSDLTSVQELKLHGITDLISLMEQAP